MTSLDSSGIHPKAVVEDGAAIGSGCRIGAFAVIGPDVTLHGGVEVMAHAVIDGCTEIGSGTVIYPFASIGHAPQNIAYKGERTRLVIGERNSIREYATMNLGTVDGGGVTRVGSDGMFMLGTHVGHDCIVGDNVIMANHASLGGHCFVGDNVMIGAHSGVHQRCRIGKGAMIGGLSAVVRDVIPFGTVSGERARLKGLNVVGLKRQGIERVELDSLRSAYASIFRNGGNIRENAADIRASNHQDALVREITDFVLDSSARSLCTPSDD